MTFRSLFAAAILLLSLSACTSLPEINPADHTTGKLMSLSDTEQALGGSDPVEPFNRSMFAVNDTLMHYAVRPLGYVYGSILPHPVIHRIDNVSDNLAFPGRMISCFLQAKFAGGGTEFARFLLNSTIGIAGIFDPAAYYFSLLRQQENMGKAFASWGIGPGCFLILPFSTAVNVRDQIGAGFDSLLDIKFILPYAGYIAYGNRVFSSYDLYDAQMRSSADPYETFKLALAALRYAELRDAVSNPLPAASSSLPATPPFIPKARVHSIRNIYRPVHPLVDTLRVEMFDMQRNDSSIWQKNSLWNSDFVSHGEIRSVRSRPASAPREYQFWRESPDSNALVLLLPGVGAHFTNSTARSFAELLSNHHYAVAVVSNPMNWAASVDPESACPGYTPSDVKEMQLHLRAILDDLQLIRHFSPSRIVVLGYSLGGLETLHLARLEDAHCTLNADRFVAINPPVNLLHALRLFDRLFEVSKNWTRSQYFDNLADVIAKFMPAAARKHPYQKTPNRPAAAGSAESDALYRVPVSPDQAAVMFGVSFRLTMRELILEQYRRNFATANVENSVLSRTGLYRDIDNMSGMDYVKKFVQPRHPGMTVEQIGFNSGLRPLGDFLRTSPRIRVIHNLDDPILTPLDAAFLDNALRSRMEWFDCGAHMGNLYLEDFHRVLLDAVNP